MANTISSLNRREFLAASLGSLSRPGLAAEKKTVAAIVTEYRYYSHADVICGRILEGYTPNNVRVQPRTRIISMYTDQIADKDMSRDLAAKHNFKIYPTVAEALTLGGKSLGVDAVLLIGEHGKYPTNEIGQTLYPRYELFEQIIQVFRKSSRAVPLFSDKHLSYSWPKARDMYRQAREIGFPFMAGSSIPVTIRIPELELPIDCKLENALSIGYGGLDSYGFHTLETLQCMVERRAGGEKGLEAVETREGEAVWKWRDSPEGRWSAPLLESALARSTGKKAGPPEQNARKPTVFLLQYRDGFRAASFMLDGHVSDFLFAAKLERPRGAGLLSLRPPCRTRLAALRRAGSLHRRDVRHPARRLSGRAHGLDYRGACLSARIAASSSAARDPGAEHCVPSARARLLSTVLAYETPQNPPS